MTPRQGLLLRCTTLVVLFVAGALLGETVLLGPDRVTLVWLPAGIALAMLLLYGRQYWPLIPLAEVVHQAIAGAGMAPEREWLLLALATASANTVGALLGATVVLRLAGPEEQRFALRTGGALVVGAVVLALSSALIGVNGLVLAGYTPSAVIGAAYLKWIVANLFGVALTAPAMLLAARSLAWRRTTVPFAVPPTLTEIVLWVSAAAGGAAVTVAIAAEPSPYALGAVALPLVLLVWSALRFRPLFTALMSLLLGLTMVMAAGHGIGGFEPPDSLRDSIALLLFLSVIAVMPLLLAAAVEESRVASYKLLQRARRDDLTGLPNRIGFEAAVREIAARADGEPLTLAYIDLDNFKLINDTAGHVAGDAMLCRISGLLRAELHRDDLLARLGGDEFAVLLRECPPDRGERIADRLRRSISDFRSAHDGHVFSPTASIGLVSFRAGEGDYSDLLAQADAASFLAKDQGGNRVRRSQAGDSVAASTVAMQWAVRLNQALAEDQIQLYCQRIVPLADATRGAAGCHFEVLIRLHDPAHDRILSPADFVAAAERFRLGPPLDRYVIDRTLRWLETHPQAAARVEMCGINLCAASVDDEAFARFLRDRLEGSCVAAEQLCFEITETSAVRDLGEARRFIDNVRALGCHLALDDFGTGFCSFAYLNALDVDWFKIDGSFVREIDHSPLALSIVRSIAEIARGIDRHTIAESVENEAIRARLLEVGVDFAQGYAIERPMPIEEFFGVSHEPARAAG